MKYGLPAGRIVGKPFVLTQTVGAETWRLVPAGKLNRSKINLMTSNSRRTFVKKSMAATASLTALSHSRALGANEKIVVGVMGLGGRGTFLANEFAKRSDCEIAWLCDADTRRFGRARVMVEEEQGRLPKITQNFREILDDKNVDVLINATPDHWHVLGSILACQAGKDVYVEKPMSYNIWEGKKLVEAAEKYKRVVQVGMQSRSAPYMREAADYIKSGKLGDVHLVRVYNMMKHSIQKPSADEEPPAGFDYDVWCGPAAKLPYNAGRRWLNQYEYSCGPIAGDAVHQIDLARLLMGDPKAPATVSATCGIYSLKDGRDTPDTQVATFEYDGFTLLFEASLWTPYMKKTSMDIRDTDKFPDWPFSATKIEVLGTTDFMVVGRHGGGWQAFNSDCKPVASVPGRQADKEHVDNFFDCVRNRKPANANAEQGHLSAMVSHLANVAGRAGNAKLKFDGATESFPDSPEANRYLKRASYRAPWIVPDQV